jgi:hypothetical protein
VFSLKRNAGVENLMSGWQLQFYLQSILRDLILRNIPEVILKHSKNYWRFHNM